MKKAPLGLVGHRDLGAKLFAIRNELIGIHLGHHYSVNGKECRLLDQALKYVDKLRSELDERAYEELRINAGERMTLYYPGTPGGRSATERDQEDIET